jgi:hypothetical protein
LTVRVLAGRTGRVGVGIEALDSKGSSLARVTTDGAGVGLLDVGRAERVTLVFSLAGSPSEEDSSERWEI